MSIPQDPVMLLSYVNTKLRDDYASLDVFCERENAQKEDVVQALNALGYEYDEQKNQFI